MKNLKNKKSSIDTQIPFTVSIIATQKNNKPCLELRRVTTDQEIIKNILMCAFDSTPIIIMPTFNNRIRAIASLIEKGILYQKKESGSDKFYFTF